METPVAQVVVKWANGAQQAWCQATSRSDLSAAEVRNLYGRRFTIEETIRAGKSELGLREPPGRSKKGVLRTAPLSLLRYSLIVL